MTRKIPRVLTIAGSDSGGGAGIQADLKTFAAHRVYGMSAITAVTAQNTVAVTAVHEVPAELVSAQIDAVFDDIGVDVVKIGMLANASIVHAVAATLQKRPKVPIVLDPVMISKSGEALLADAAVAALRDELAPLATLLTPNLPEAERLTGMPVTNERERIAAARHLTADGGVVLIKGGHAPGDRVIDLLVTAADVRSFEGPRIDTRSTHGTGCTLSSAIAARLALGIDLVPAVRGAIAYLRTALRAAVPLGAGHGPVDHLHPFDEKPVES